MLFVTTSDTLTGQHPYNYVCNETFIALFLCNKGLFFYCINNPIIILRLEVFYVNVCTVNCRICITYQRC